MCMYMYLELAAIVRERLQLYHSHVLNVATLVSTYTCTSILIGCMSVVAGHHVDVLCLELCYVIWPS